MMRVGLITGCNGFCGTHLARRLRAEGGIRILGAGRSPAPSGTENLDDYIRADVCDQDQVANLVHKAKPDFVFHLAGLADGAAADIYRTNLLSVLYFLDSLPCHATNARILLVGSAAEYGHVPPENLPATENCPCQPTDHYAVSKHAMTLAALKYAKHFRIKVVVARPFNIIGAGIPPHLLVGAVLSRAKQVLLNGGESVIKIGDLDSERDFVAVEDVAEAYLRMVLGSYWGEVFNLCSGRPSTVRSVVSLLLSHSKRPMRLETDPYLLRSSEPKIIYGSWEKANRAFGYKPAVSLEDSLRAAWMHEIRG